MPDQQKSVHPQRARLKVVGLMVALSMMSYIDRTVMSIAAPDVIREFGISETQMGAVFSAFILSYAILMLPGGWLADRIGARVVLTMMGAGAAACTLATALVTQPILRTYLSVIPAFLAVRFLLGAFTAPLYPACARITANWVPPSRRGRVQGFIIAGAPLGAALTPVTFSWLIGQYGWRVSFYFAAVATAALAAIWHFSVRERPPDLAVSGSESAAVSARPPVAAEARAVLRHLFRNRNMALLAVGYFTLNYFEYIFFYWIYYYFGEIRGMPRSESAVYTTILLLAMMVMMPAAGWLSDRLIPRLGVRASRQSVAVGGMALSAVCLYAGTSLDSTAWIVTLLALALGLAASSEGPYWAAAIDAGGPYAGAAGGMMNGIGNVGGLLAPVLTPLIASRFGWSIGLYFASALILVGAASWLFLAAHKARTDNPAESRETRFQVV